MPAAQPKKTTNHNHLWLFNHQKISGRRFFEKTPIGFFDWTAPRRSLLFSFGLLVLIGHLA
jgi:hypothetical protein